MNDTNTGNTSEEKNKRLHDLKQKLVHMDLEKLDHVSESLEKMTKSKWFQWIVILIAVLIAFGFRP